MYKQYGFFPKLKLTRNLEDTENYKNFKQKSSERTWFVSILKNKIIDHYRKTAGKTVNDDKGNRIFENSFDENEKWKPEFAPVAWGDDPEKAFEQVEFMEILKECLTALPKKLAGIFTSREIEDKKSEIICKELNISLSNLWVMLHRSRAQLRRCLELNWFST